MQLKTTQGTMMDVPASEIQKAYASMHKTMHSAVAKLAAMDQEERAQMIVDIYEKACQYKAKAAKNIQRITGEEECPETQDDMKDAYGCILIRQDADVVADATYEMMQFESARFLTHLLKDYVKD